MIILNFINDFLKINFFLMENINYSNVASSIIRLLLSFCFLLFSSAILFSILIISWLWISGLLKTIISWFYWEKIIAKFIPYIFNKYSKSNLKRKEKWFLNKKYKTKEDFLEANADLICKIKNKLDLWRKGDLRYLETDGGEENKELKDKWKNWSPWRRCLYKNTHFKPLTFIQVQENDKDIRRREIWKQFLDFKRNYDRWWR